MKGKRFRLATAAIFIVLTAIELTHTIMGRSWAGYYPPLNYTIMPLLFIIWMNAAFASLAGRRWWWVAGIWASLTAVTHGCGISLGDSPLYGALFALPAIGALVLIVVAESQSVAPSVAEAAPTEEPERLRAA